MTNKKSELNLEKKFGYVVLNGDYYIIDHEDGKPIFVKESKKKVNEQIRKAKAIAKKLVTGLDGEKLLTEIIMNEYREKEMDRLYKMIFKSKRKYKPKTRAGHCVDMKVGNVIIPLVD